MTKRLRLMSVDDDEDVVVTLTEYFSSQGFEIRGYTDPTAALDDLAKGEFVPDVILLDIVMPVVDGYEFCRRVRSQQGLSDLPIVFLTGKSQQDDSLAFLQSGGQLYAKKPFELSELMAITLLAADEKLSGNGETV